MSRFSLPSAIAVVRLANRAFSSTAVGTVPASATSSDSTPAIVVVEPGAAACVALLGVGIGALAEHPSRIVSMGPRMTAA